MMLYVNGQDIKQITFGIVGTSVKPPVRTVQIGPEGFLSALDDFLKDNHQTVKDIKRIFAVIGPGSATALRATMSIVNTIRFMTKIQLIGIEKNPLEQDVDTIKAINQGKIKPVIKGELLIPIYAQPARITLSTRDYLGRK
ncbi:hypothetical protein IH979_03375 [Patescibacteria group bacterium]|nr:hypothetical protein [Patescibacteria group bacterium]